MIACVLQRRVSLRKLLSLLACASSLLLGSLRADTIAVRHQRGSLHGFLVLRTLDGKVLADGDITQVTQGDRVTAHLLFRFKDGSIHEETSTYSQRGTFRLLSSHLKQSGPAFKRSTETVIDATTGQVTVRYSDDDGKEKVITDKIFIPTDAANGIVPTLLENIGPASADTSVSMVTATPRPRVVKLVIHPDGQESFSIGGSSYKATRYTVKVEIKGAAGVVAPLVGKAPPDMHIWVMGGNAPVFLKSEGPLYEGGPVWRIELASPLWPQDTAASSVRGDAGR